jgi:glyoxylase-like metal-dependent hydrolase (beta-lactamase superfamily II)
MSEPRAVAGTVEEVVPGVWHWRVHDERIDFVSSAHAVAGSRGAVLIDPLPLTPQAQSLLGPIHAVVLTTSSHQRSAWRLRRELGMRVWAPASAQEVEEEPDERYGDGDLLPGDLLAVFTPGAGTRQHSLLDERRGVLFTPDLFVVPPGGALALTPAQYMHDPAEARRSAERLLELDFSVLCTGHGEPVRGDPKAAIRAALAA